MASRRPRASPRPQSSSSNNTRMTPSSSNSSSAHLPSRMSQATTVRGSSGGSLLQERLRERKIETARQNSRSVGLGAGGEKRVQSSPVKGPIPREERRPSSGGVGAGKGMGVKQIEEVSLYHVPLRHWLTVCSKFRPCTNRILISSSNYTIAANDRKRLKQNWKPPKNR